MEYHLQTGSHTVYALQYHFVTVTKYRADILTDERLERVAEISHDIADDFEADIKNVDGGTDHTFTSCFGPNQPQTSRSSSTRSKVSRPAGFGRSFPK